MQWKAVVALAMGLGVIAAAVPAHAQVDVEQYVRDETYSQIKISPDGKHYAATVPLEGQEVLVIIRRADNVPTAKISGREDTALADFWWVSNTRVVGAMAEKFGRDDTPSLTGELVAVDIDGKRARKLATPDGYGYVLMHDELPLDDDNVLVTRVTWGPEPQTALEKMNVYTGDRSPVSAAPLARARFLTDRAGNARFASGRDKDGNIVLFYRDPGNQPWRKINDEGDTGIIESPLGFSDDGKVAYLWAERTTGPDAIIGWDIASGQRTELLRHPRVDPAFTVEHVDRPGIAGAVYMHDGTSSLWIDPQSPTSRYQRTLERAFPGQTVRITSHTRDGALLLALVFSDRNPGEFYVYDTAAKKVLPLYARRLWIDPEAAAPTRLVTLTSRDGLELHGYLTRPKGAADGTPLPMVVVPHGGPYGEHDDWWFDDDVQVLASAGYTVLRVNFRGSSNYGRKFLIEGQREWGRGIQTDLVDATRWAIAQRIADPARICIAGASHGGYASLAAVADEPTLFKCAVGYVGVYDLERVHKEIRGYSRADDAWADLWLGTRDQMPALSVIAKASRIQVPVFLAAGGKDRVAPVEHTERMEKALRAAGVPVETLYYPNEGHGFYVGAHRAEYYRRLLAFLSRHLGGATAK